VLMQFNMQELDVQERESQISKRSGKKQDESAMN